MNLQLHSDPALRKGRICDSFFVGGFECSCHRTLGGNRLDMLEASAHAKLFRGDYYRVRQHGIRTVRDGIRWHLIETDPGRYDFSSVVPMVRAARDAQVQVIWDLCHFGWPDHLNVFSTAFIEGFARMARAFLRVLAGESDQMPVVAPINEISFLAWVAGEVGQFYPFARGRGDELKQQLVLATIEAIEAIWDVVPGTRIVQTDPAINIVAGGTDRAQALLAETLREAQFHAWDMLTGRRMPQLGGHPKYVDVIGLNYYPTNQWIHCGPRLDRAHHQYQPLQHFLRENYSRYGRPILLAETGTEGRERPGWLRYVAREVRQVMLEGAPMAGICWYPIINHPGWDDGRHCENGMWDYPDATGDRPVYAPLARELHRQEHRFCHFFANSAEPSEARRPPNEATHAEVS